jgi:selenocysteine-specific translation elongation factor
MDAVGAARGHIVLKNFIQPEELAPLVRGTVAEGYHRAELDANKLNDIHVNGTIPPNDGPVRIPVDHHFDVKGVGTVVLGCVRRGVVNVHDELQLYPTQKVAHVKSIQVHDTDVKQAVLANRVGLAVKNVSNADFDRGFVLAPKGSLSAADELTVDFAAYRYWKGELSKDAVIHVAVGLQIRPAKVLDVSGGSAKGGSSGLLRLKSDRPFAYEVGERAVLLDLDSKGLRVAGFGAIR